jgi:signal peptide peptidase SppA
MPSRNYDHVLSFALDHPWAITRPMLAVVAGIIARRIAGRADPEAIEAAVVNRKALPQPRAGSAAIIPVYGVIAPRLNAMSEMSGGTTFERLSGQLRECMANPAIKTIILDVDSPGGNVAGATEFANQLLAARAKKPILGQVQYTGASAAYWLLACTTQIIAAPSARIGSIGIYTSHDDLSSALKSEGITRTIIAAGDGKVDGNDAEPLGEEARGRIQKLVDETYAVMVADIVKGRGQGVTDKRVRGEWRAHVYGATEAISLGLIDRIGTLEDTLARTLGASGEPVPIDLTAQLSTVPALDTAQEPARATAQDRTAEAALERQLFELSLL